LSFKIVCIYKQAVLFYRAVFNFTYTPTVVYITFVQNVTCGGEFVNLNK